MIIIILDILQKRRSRKFEKRKTRFCHNEAELSSNKTEKPKVRNGAAATNKKGIHINDYAFLAETFNFCEFYKWLDRKTSKNNVYIFLDWSTAFCHDKFEEWHWLPETTVWTK